MIDISAILLKFSDVLPSAIGSFVSMKFLPPGLNRFQKLFALLSSLAIGSYFGRGIAEYLNITNIHMSDAIVFGTALFGLSLVGSIFSEIKPVLVALRKHFLQ